MSFSAWAKCPLCGFKNRIGLVNAASGRPEIIMCGDGASGCGDHFAFEVEMKVTVKTAVISDLLTDEEHAHEKELRERAQ